ncbi:MAG: hypothetical protein IKG47_09800 [Oscillospiraceae bacterium]|nr:hypothetical protein [Oscillospiraceae bacterium]
MFGGDSAKESCELYKDALRGGVPERGAFVFYDCLCPGENGPVNWGHCGISFGNGRVIHAWDRVRIDDYLAIEKLTAYYTRKNQLIMTWDNLPQVILIIASCAIFCLCCISLRTAFRYSISITSRKPQVFRADTKTE